MNKCIALVIGDPATVQELEKCDYYVALEFEIPTPIEALGDHMTLLRRSLLAAVHNDAEAKSPTEPQYLN